MARNRYNPNSDDDSNTAVLDAPQEDTSSLEVPAPEVDADAEAEVVPAFPELTDAPTVSRKYVHQAHFDRFVQMHADGLLGKGYEVEAGTAASLQNHLRDKKGIRTRVIRRGKNSWIGLDKDQTPRPPKNKKAPVAESEA